MLYVHDDKLDATVAYDLSKDDEQDYYTIQEALKKLLIAKNVLKRADELLLELNDRYRRATANRTLTVVLTIREIIDDLIEERDRMLADNHKIRVNDDDVCKVQTIRMACLDGEDE